MLNKLFEFLQISGQDSLFRIEIFRAQRCRMLDKCEAVGVKVWRKVAAIMDSNGSGLKNVVRQAFSFGNAEVGDVGLLLLKTLVSCEILDVSVYDRHF